MPRQLKEGTAPAAAPEVAAACFLKMDAKSTASKTPQKRVEVA